MSQARFAENFFCRMLDWLVMAENFDDAETLILGAEAAAGRTLKFFVPQFFCKISAFHVLFPRASAKGFS
eukprot:s3889_g9.t1